MKSRISSVLANWFCVILVIRGLNSPTRTLLTWSGLLPYVDIIVIGF